MTAVGTTPPSPVGPTDPTETETPLLSARGVSKRFDGIQALSDVALDLHAGECVGLIGPNGAGKTTLFDCLTGRLTPDAGELRLRDQRLDGLSAARRARLGLARTFQRVELFAGMSVDDHLTVAVQARNGRARLWRDLLGRGHPMPAERERVDAILGLLGLRPLADRPIESLTLGQRRLVELGRALACAPVLLFLDEPSSGLARAETHDLAALLEDVRDRWGVAILLVEHDVPLVRRLATRTYVLDAGRLIAHGPTDEVLADPAVHAAYLGNEYTAPSGEGPPPRETSSGGAVDHRPPPGEPSPSSTALDAPTQPAAPHHGEASPSSTGSDAPTQPAVIRHEPSVGGTRPRDAIPARLASGGAGPDGAEQGPVLELEQVDAGYGAFRALFGVSLSVPANAAVALVGPNGAGKTTVARVCSGLLAPTSGRVRLRGDDVTGLPAHVLARRGVAHANEGRSVFASLTVEENLTLAFRAAFGRSGVSGALDEAYGLFARLGQRRRQVAGSLSGGEQRMLTLARTLIVRPRVLVADELSLGLAPVVVDEVYDALGHVRDAGTSVVVVEQRLDRALAFADRAVVLDTGQVTWEGPATELDDHASQFLHTSPL